MPFTFHEGAVDGLKLNFDPGIFHDVNHLKLQVSSGWHSYYMTNENSVEAILHVHIQHSEARSPFRSPFGSVLFSAHVTPDALHNFVAFCEERLRQLNSSRLILKNQPEIYSDRNSLLTNELAASGFMVKDEEASAVIPICATPYENGLHKSEKKRLRKCREHGLVFELMELNQLQKIYMFLDSCRKEKGYALSMTFDEVEKLAQVFPERIILTAVVDKQKMAAANISIRVYDHVLYNFYHDHSSAYDHLSPVVLLNEGLYQVCQAKKIQFLDLGTSNIDGRLNESLFAFKLNLGARPSRKLTFEKLLV